MDRHVRESAHAIGITPHLGKDPHKLSCGERRLVAIAKAVMAEVGILILDEPTMGVDPFAQRKLGKLLHELAKRGVTVLIASQDLKFCAEYATNVSLLNGDIATTNTPQAFFSSNTLYTTEASRISRMLYSNTVTDDEVIILCLENGWQKQ